ncbi:hypothetical protein EVAR_41737_1 [Eumeta japonica]|uniref:Uncharacterized protein n=1 Tax=Eumeta variegata TaxID=151549 RepID=A0A4C1VYJ1_EUMVA|nr:hypothetical protein EVAR_41737_1 [Eumeta japonica]
MERRMRHRNSHSLDEATASTAEADTSRLYSVEYGIRSAESFYCAAATLTKAWSQHSKFCMFVYNFESFVRNGYHVRPEVGRQLSEHAANKQNCQPIVGSLAILAPSGERLTRRGSYWRGE